jgi:hypothetical protein
MRKKMKKEGAWNACHCFLQAGGLVSMRSILFGANPRGEDLHTDNLASWDLPHIENT